MTDGTTPNELFSVGQIRLKELSVYNWGSFSNAIHTAEFHPKGTLITGDNGAGKSTFIDALTALLLTAGKASFNVAAAQGGSNDRSLLSYMRGSYGSVHDGSKTRTKSKRDVGVVTGLRALYQGDDGSCITLCGLFWIGAASSTLKDVNRNYFVAKRNVSLKEVLDHFRTVDARELSAWLNNDPEIINCGKNFTEYEETYRRFLYMENRNAPALLSRALGLKKIDDLTSLIRTLVLEPSNIREDAASAVKEFSDLVATHKQIIDAKKQISHLFELPEQNKIYHKSDEEAQSLELESAAVRAYFGEQSAKLWGIRLASLNNELNTIQQYINDKAAEIDFQKDMVETRNQEYREAGGGRIDKIRADIKAAQDALNRITQESSRYQNDMTKLGLNPILSFVQFSENLKRIEQMIETQITEQEQLISLNAKTKNNVETAISKGRSLDAEIKDIESRPDSNIQLDFQTFRDRMVLELGLDRDKIVFFGELIDIKEDQLVWKGAIERALGGLRTTLAVPENCIKAVTWWINKHHLGIHVRIQEVKQAALNPGYINFNPNGYLAKLEWKQDHVYRDFLKHFLKRHDLTCVDSTEQLNQFEFSMTREGQIHKEKGRYEKNDNTKIDDRRHWNLGFSNKARLEVLREELEEIQSQISKYQKEYESAKDSLNRILDNGAIINRARQYQWDQIDAPYWQSRSEALLKELEALENSDGNLSKANQRLQEAKEALAQMEKDKERMVTDKGSLSEKIRTVNANQQQSFEAAKIGLLDVQRESLEKRVGLIKDEDLDRIETIESNHKEAIARELKAVNGRRNNARGECGKIMATFRQQWDVIAEGWGVDIPSVHDYLDHLKILENENLPELLNDFKERLSKHATQSLARLHQSIDSERSEIIDRISVINQVLRKTEFSQGTYLRLKPIREEYPHVTDFNRQVRVALSNVTSDDYDTRFEQLKAVIDILDRASHPTTASNMESQRLLDARFQLSFVAEEIIEATGEINDVLDSSSGKSGGEKESFAGTIVAASLAYVLTPDGCDRPIYSTVFLDEAFSNTAEAVSRRVLRVFNELKIHVNLITPFKNLNLARDFAASLLIAERDKATHESRLSQVTWKQLNKIVAEQKQADLKSSSDLDIQIDLVEDNDDMKKTEA